MKAIIILTLLCCPLFADGLTPLLDAIRQVESGGNDNAIGDGGQALVQANVDIKLKAKVV